MLPNKEGKKMPPKFKFTREEIIQAALDLTRESVLFTAILNFSEMKKIISHLKKAAKRNPNII